jgi:protein tyrosine/serine phosphatase
MFVKSIKYLSMALIVIVTFAFIMIEVIGNFYKVDNNIYRSGQLNKYNLPYYIDKYNIKTILNLRGEAKDAPWYINEKRYIEKKGGSLINYDMWSDHYYNFKQTSKLVQLIKNAKKPLLIHCMNGADRTSLAVALYQFAIAKKTPKEAKEQFSIKYGHSPYFRKHVIQMDNSFDNYVQHILK